MDVTKGVNLGGWLVLERWITPTVFQGTEAKDEYSLSRTLGETEFRERIQRHRETFITEDHIKAIKARGIEFVRLPVGYWLFKDQDGFVAAKEHVDRLFNWAKQYGLKVILDIHAAPGSQNGQDHSGKAGENGWIADPETYTERTLRFVAALCEEYGARSQLLAVEVLNEPGWHVRDEVLLDYYRKAHATVQRNCSSRVWVIVGDSFRPEEMSKKVKKLGLERIVLDVHLYQLFTDEDRALELEGHVRKTDKEWSKLLRKVSRRLPVMIGEWSAAMSELYNPRMDERQRQYVADDYVKYYDAQKRAFEGAGVPWVYWTARTEDGGVWSLLDQPDFRV